MKLRDRDAIVTKEGLIFRVFGYSHPPETCVCDVEYAPAKLFTSDNLKAYRNNGTHTFYKFYGDEGWNFIRKGFPQYMILHEMLGKNVLGVNRAGILEILKPGARLAELVEGEPKDALVSSMQNILEFVMPHSGLSAKVFGVFGSMLCGFHNPKFSDIDLIIYGRNQAAKLIETLNELYTDPSSLFQNEFDTDQSIRGKSWLFKNYSSKEFLEHQRRKLIYALFNSRESDRIMKTEFEPVKDWKEIRNEYDSGTRILQRGWVDLVARITEDDDAFFIPSIYGIEPLQVMSGVKEAAEARRIVSYMEEFRLQARRDEKVRIAGNLEEVVNSKGSFYQIVLTYCPRYYEQVLKVATDAS
jgi:predicted nucleotidyltransferase